jgi:hypothetical protein
MLTRDTREIGKIPDESAGVYCFDAVRNSTCYVGQSSNLRDRIRQHLERLDSSVITPNATVSLNVELISGARCWTSPEFKQGLARKAAEQVAFEVLKPTLNSLGAVQAEVKGLANSQPFRAEMEELFQGEPNYVVTFPSIKDLVTRILNLEAQLSDLSAKVESL